MTPRVGSGDPRRAPGRRRAVRTLAALAAGLLTVGVGASPAVAADGQWYVSAFHLTDNHAVATGAGVTVAVIDGLVDPAAPSLAGADVVPAASTSCQLPDGSSPTTGSGVATNHATAMTTVIAGQGGSLPLGVAPGAKVLTYVTGYSSAGDGRLACSNGTDADQAAADAVRDATAQGARIVSMSFGGVGSPALGVAILYAMRQGVVFVASTDDVSDTGTRVDPPASFNGVVVVNGIDSTGALIDRSATGAQDGPLVVAAAPGRDVGTGGFDAAGAWDPAVTTGGSSSATAFVAGALAVTLSKFPSATGNQLIQSLARTTGGEEHGLTARAQDGYGFGVVSLTGMLAHDPSAYPDVNPLLRDGATPSTADILAGATTAPASSSPVASQVPTSAGPASATPAAAADGGGGTSPLVWVLVAVAALVVVGALAAVLLARRRGPRPPPGSGPHRPIPTATPGAPRAGTHEEAR